MYCCAWCQHFRNTEKEGSDGYCFVDGTEVRLEDVCDEFVANTRNEHKGGLTVNIGIIKTMEYTIKLDGSCVFYVLQNKNKEVSLSFEVDGYACIYLNETESRRLLESLKDVFEERIKEQED